MQDTTLYFRIQKNEWLLSDTLRPYDSWGNGSAMRVNPVGFALNGQDQVLEGAKRTAEVTHNVAAISRFGPLGMMLLAAVLLGGSAAEAVATGTIDSQHVVTYIGSFFANFQFRIDLLSLLIQGVFVSRLVKHMGVGLPSSRRAKYLAKQAIDTFFVRMGDASSALIIFVGIKTLNLPLRIFAALNVLLVVIWLVVARGIVTERARLPADAGEEYPGTSAS